VDETGSGSNAAARFGTVVLNFGVLHPGSCLVQQLEQPKSRRFMDHLTISLWIVLSK
jgi:hypothetical protein